MNLHQGHEEAFAGLIAEYERSVRNPHCFCMGCLDSSRRTCCWCGAEVYTQPTYGPVAGHGPRRVAVRRVLVNQDRESVGSCPERGVK